MSVPTLLELAESGAHFGHHRSLVFPKAKGFIYGIKRSVALINLEETQKRLSEAQKIYSLVKTNGGNVLIVGTKHSIRAVVEQIADAEGISFITERWLGGFLTNFDSFLENIKRMNDLRDYLNGEDSKGISKAERLRETNKLAKQERFLKGVSTLKVLPELLVLASASQDKIAVGEANQIGVPVIAITDTDMNPELITYPIPANDDAPRAVELILHSLVSTELPVKPPKVQIEKPVDEPKKRDAKVKTETKKDIVSKPKTTKNAPTKAKAPVKKTAAKKAPVKKAVKKGK